jgi:mannose-6-phosphate isomerase-like protein (cupin superfamily)
MSVLDVTQLSEKHLADHWGFFGRTILDRPDLVILHADMEAGGGAEPHVHAHSDHLFVVLAGQIVMTIDGEEHVAGAHQLLHVPAGLPHATVNPGPEAARYVAVTYEV